MAALREVLGRGPYTEVDYQVVPDEQAIIRARLRRWADEGAADLVLTLGGVGAALRHRTPEATLEVIDRQFPGIPEVLRSAGSRVEPTAGLWRVVAGVRRNTLIVNLPGGAVAAKVSLGAVSHLLVWAAGLISSQKVEIGGPEGSEGGGTSSRTSG